MSNLLNRIQGCMLGIAIGDALGMPVETMSHEKIMTITGGKGITDFVDPVNEREWTKDIKAGETTDDWQLTRAVANSIIRSRGKFDLIRCVQEHVSEMKQSKFGWGHTTRAAIEDIINQKRDPITDRLAPAPPGKGCGNGIVMKVAPLAITNYLFNGSLEDLWNDVRILGGITHPDIRASIAAYAVALVYSRILDDRTKSFSAPGVIDHVCTFVRLVERDEQTSSEVSDLIYRSMDAWHGPASLRTMIGCGFIAQETAAFAIATFCRHPRNFEEGILEAVNAGGDTDTNASIVGGLIGANVGLSRIPERFREINVYDECCIIGHKLSLLAFE